MQRNWNLIASASSSRSFGTGTKFVKFNYEDPFDLEELLTEDEKMIRDSAR
jgi:hypothetical protein